MLDTQIENIILKTTDLNNELKRMQKEVRRAETDLGRHKDMPIKLKIYEKGFDERTLTDPDVIKAILKTYAEAAKKRVRELEVEIENEFKKYRKGNTK